ncbi:MAG: hypothetical protein ACR2L2_06575 [Acidobacteriota bacterium]
METLKIQAATVESARKFVGGLPLAITPITFRPRFNPEATEMTSIPCPDELPAEVDPRQMSLFGSAWTTGSLKHLCESGVDSLTYYETTGWRGVMETEHGSPLREKFYSLPGSVFPLYHVLADVGEFLGGRVIPTTSTEPITANGLAITKDGRIRVLVANMTIRPERVTVKNFEGVVQLKRLNEITFRQAVVAPEEFRAQSAETLQSSGALELELLPYEVVRIDLRLAARRARS